MLSDPTLHAIIFVELVSANCYVVLSDVKLRKLIKKCYPDGTTTRDGKVTKKSIKRNEIR